MQSSINKTNNTELILAFRLLLLTECRVLHDNLLLIVILAP